MPKGPPPNHLRFVLSDTEDSVAPKTKARETFIEALESVLCWKLVWVLCVLSPKTWETSGSFRESHLFPLGINRWSSHLYQCQQLAVGSLTFGRTLKPEVVDVFFQQIAHLDKQAVLHSHPHQGKSTRAL